jgi:hypothetical protein
MDEKDNPKQYTNRELFLLIKGNNDTNQLQHDALLASIKNFHEKTEETLKTILAQTTKTNGRVNKLENWQAGVVAVTILLSTLVPACAAWFFYKVTNLNDTVIAHISKDTKEFNNLIK